MRRANEPHLPAGRGALNPCRAFIFGPGRMSAMVAAVVVAAGRGLRAGGDIPKQYRQILGDPVIRPSLATLARHAAISAVQPVIHPDDATLFGDAVAGLNLLVPVHGGATR